VNPARAPGHGLAFGAYPQRGDDHGANAWDDALRALRSRLARCAARPLPAPRLQLLAQATTAAAALPQAGGVASGPSSGPSSDLGTELTQARATLRRQGLTGPAVAQALVLASRAMAQSQGLTPYPTQLQAAWWMLDGQLVEMATGEGKTLATALAAAVAALAGTPVHVVTANDYLVTRDAETLAPFFTLLGLRCSPITQATPPGQRGALWRHEVVYTTARELAFDYLRDHVALHGERDARLHRAHAMAAAAAASAGATSSPASAGPAGPAGLGGSAPGPALPGLCFALIDEADSVLLDEAVVPLLLAQPAPASPADVADWRFAWQLATRLQRQRDYTLHPSSRQALLTPEGRQRVTRAVAGRGGQLAPPRRAAELVQAALAARLQYRRDRDYVLVKGQLQLIDTTTGRIAEGRQWQGALHPMVELKEGLAPSHPTRTAAQITYQRFFPRYLRLGGMSGTLREARHELRVVYDCPVAQVPLARPDQRRWLGQRVFASATHKWAAVLAAVRQQHQAGRPVLVGTDSVADALHLSGLLTAQGLAHQLLTATQDVAEADSVACAGQAGCITVATNIAGRGTDIRLDAAARRHGGLHVIATMRNRSRRIDRQLIGRAARHGDPGSAEALLALDDALPRGHLPAWLRRAAAAWASRCTGDELPAALSLALMATAQRLAEAQDHQRRRQLRLAERQADALGFGTARE
jgi:preprotein translocase subunit SecA